MDPNSTQNTALFLSQQQQTLSSLIAAANGSDSITSLSQLNGLATLPSDLDKKVSLEFLIINSSERGQSFKL